MSSKPPASMETTMLSNEIPRSALTASFFSGLQRNGFMRAVYAAVCLLSPHCWYVASDAQYSKQQSLRGVIAIKSSREATGSICSPCHQRQLLRSNQWRSNRTEGDLWSIMSNLTRLAPRESEPDHFIASSRSVLRPKWAKSTTGLSTVIEQAQSPIEILQELRR